MWITNVHISRTIALSTKTYTLAIFPVWTLVILRCCDIPIMSTNNAHTSTTNSVLSTILGTKKFGSYSLFTCVLYIYTCLMCNCLRKIWGSKHVRVSVDCMCKSSFNTCALFDILNINNTAHDADNHRQPYKQVSNTDIISIHDQTTHRQLHRTHIQIDGVRPHTQKRQMKKQAAER
jgi:hypothetical protein